MTDDLESVFEEGSEIEAQAPVDDKRVNDLMSKWQKAEARARKAEAALVGGSDTASAGDPWVAAARDLVIDQVYGSDPRYGKYGIQRDFFAGGDPSMIKAASKELSALLDGIEASAVEKARAEVGYVPELGGGPVREKVDFDAMTSEQFEALIAKAKSGR